MSVITKNSGELQIGQLAKETGKSVRAIHHYEELGLLAPSGRSKGGFRKYDQGSLSRVRWILKLQSMGFSLSDIQVLIADFNDQATGPHAATHALEVFKEKLMSVREHIAILKNNEQDLQHAIAYLDACNPCTKQNLPSQCRDCEDHGHQPGKVPLLFSELTDQTEASNPTQPITLKRSQGGQHE